MAVKIRLMRMGKTKSPYYRVVVMDGRAPRDGRYIDLLGRYDPRQEPSLIDIDTEKAIDWLRKGAQPTEAAGKILEVAGAMTQFKVKSGRIHTVGASAAPAESETESEAEAEALSEPVADPEEAEAVDETVTSEAVASQEPDPEAAESTAAESEAGESEAGETEEVVESPEEPADAPTDEPDAVASEEE